MQSSLFLDLCKHEENGWFGFGKGMALHATYFKEIKDSLKKINRAFLQALLWKYCSGDQQSYYAVFHEARTSYSISLRVFRKTKRSWWTPRSSV